MIFYHFLLGNIQQKKRTDGLADIQTGFSLKNNMITFTGFKKRKESKERKRKKKLIRTAILVLLAMVVLMIVFNALLINTNRTAEYTGIQKLNPTTDSNVKDKTEDELNYDTDVYIYQLNDEEKQKLVDLGYSEKDITNGNVDDFIKELYGIEAYVQNLYMVRYTSPYEGAKEPTKEQRSQLYNSMLESYIAQNYSNVVYQFKKALKKYNFTNFLDEPITSLYHDASARIDQGLLTGTEENGDDLTLLLKDSLSNMNSAEGLLYDVFALGISQTSQIILDASSCVPLSEVYTILEQDTYDPQKQDFDHKDKMSSMADIVYYYKVETADGDVANVYIDSVGIEKHVIGVYII